MVHASNSNSYKTASERDDGGDAMSEQQAIMPTPEVMEATIEREKDHPGSYVVRAGKAILDVAVSTPSRRQAGPDLKKWLRQVIHVYGKQQDRKSKIVVGFTAKNRHNISSGASRYSAASKDMFHEMFQFCVGQHCLLIESEPYSWICTNVRTFLREFFLDRRFVFVGVGAKAIVEKIKKDHEDNAELCLIPNPVDLTELAASHFSLKDPSKCSLEMLAKLILDVDFSKPKKMVWSDAQNPYSMFSDELVMWSSVEAYLNAEIGLKLSVDKL
uniref:Uncharacterized protein n=1 Tax=Kalanchoe fedtschenkoi TaxID=63787 RepID=A0A7N0UTR3_KALFE